MSYGISLHVWGDYACFTRPELKAERVSYEVMTPSAARGILSAIYWKPQFRWVIDRIHVLKPIRFIQIMRNELREKIPAPRRAKDGTYFLSKECFFIDDIDKEPLRVQRQSLILKDVSYVIDAHVEIIEQEKEVNSVAKHLEVFKRRASKGQCFHQPCLGTREFYAMFELVDGQHFMPVSTLPEDQRNRHLGMMLHDLVYVDDPKGKIICAHTGKKQSVVPTFYMADLRDGVLHVPPHSQTFA